ncbi:MAG TPA: hypothetical protein VHF69_03670 [Candidatus Synoicihabitans sp.]|nr:hypothetical protein [Candidatus Synoicihabitans sp.]
MAMGLLMAFVGPSAPARSAGASEQLQVAMTVFKVTEDAFGNEALLPAEEARPGDVLLYRAAYRNSGKSALREVAAHVPVPPGLAYVNDSARPAAEAASIDGRAFFSIAQPPTPTPPPTWRTLRWAARDLAAGADFTVELRARVLASGETAPPGPSAR